MIINEKGLLLGNRINNCLGKDDEANLKLIRSNRRTISLEITPSGQVLVRAPRNMAEAEIQGFVEEKSSWLAKHLKRREEDMDSLQAEGRFTEEEIEKMLKLAKQVIPEKVAYYARLMGVTYGRITIRKQKTRWGSCSREGNLNFNCLLMMVPPEVLDYVVVHELSHRLEMNHSSRFWSQVEKVIPNYRKLRKWLKENGSCLMLRMHGIADGE